MSKPKTLSDLNAQRILAMAQLPTGEQKAFLDFTRVCLQECLMFGFVFGAMVSLVSAIVIMVAVRVLS